ncbi:MAG: CD225/dispanin family protein [Phycisphaerales bacterium]|nr:CD225/dispanin family protein [Phycisphaerales bacterium]
MYCIHCGSENEDGAQYCVTCGGLLQATTSQVPGDDAFPVQAPSDTPTAEYAPVGQAPAEYTTPGVTPIPPAPPIYPATGMADDLALGPASPHLIPAILVTLFCCQPLGIVAIVFAALAMSNNGTGQYAAARQNAKRAAMFGWIAFGIGFAFWALYAVFIIIVGVSGGF